MLETDALSRRRGDRKHGRGVRGRERRIRVARGVCTATGPPEPVPLTALTASLGRAFIKCVENDVRATRHRRSQLSIFFSFNRLFLNVINDILNP